MRSAVAVIVVASTIVAGAPRLARTATLARELARLQDLEARRSMLFGPWYASLQRLRRAVGNAATIDFVPVKPEARDIAVLGAAELQPRDVRLFDGWDAWRRRERAILVHDSRAANAVPGPPPARAEWVVVVDPAAAESFRIAEPPQ